MPSLSGVCACVCLAVLVSVFSLIGIGCCLPGLILILLLAYQLAAITLCWCPILLCVYLHHCIILSIHPFLFHFKYLVFFFKFCQRNCHFWLHSRNIPRFKKQIQIHWQWMARIALFASVKNGLADKIKIFALLFNCNFILFHSPFDNHFTIFTFHFALLGQLKKVRVNGNLFDVN